MEVLNKIKTRFREETFTRDNILEVILNHSELVRMLYINFAMTHCAWSCPAFLVRAIEQKLTELPIRPRCG
jgi:hypothetical protein